MGTREGETQDTGNTDLTLLPPSRTVRPAGGWVLWRPQRTRRQDRTGGLQGGARSGTHGGSVSSGGHGRTGVSGGHGGSASEAAAPTPAPASTAGALKKNVLGESRGSIGHLKALWRRGHLGALGKRGHCKT